MLRKKIVEALQTCVDPEIRMDIWTLALVYKIEINDGNVKVVMTLTSPACPFGPQMIEDVKEKVGKVEGVKSVEVEVVFEPPWNPSEDLKMLLGVQV